MRANPKVCFDSILAGPGPPRRPNSALPSLAGGGLSPMHFGEALLPKAPGLDGHHLRRPRRGRTASADALWGKLNLPEGRPPAKIMFVKKRLTPGRNCHTVL